MVQNYFWTALILEVSGEKMVKKMPSFGFTCVNGAHKTWISFSFANPYSHTTISHNDIFKISL